MAAGLPATEDEALKARVVRVSLPIDDVIRKVAGYMQTGVFGLYRRGPEIGTIDEGTGEWRPMTARRFRSWLPMSCGIIPVLKFNPIKTDREDDDGVPIQEQRPVRGDLTLDQAATILESDELRIKVPVVEHINRVKVPVIRKALDECGKGTGEYMEIRKGFRRIELLQHGYDKESKTFTLRGGLDYQEDMDADEAVRLLRRILGYFPWAEPRSMSVQLAAMLTIYGARLFTGRSPMFLWNANLPGSGKSRLAQLCLHPVHGSAARAGFSYEDKNEVRKELDAVAQAFGPYVFFDDLQRGKVRNEHLHRWLTAPDWSCRIMGTKELFHGPLFSATLMTGNELTLNDDLERRTLIVDLFSRVTARDRVLPKDVMLLDDDFFADEDRMAEILAALWSLIQHWDMACRPKTKEKALDSFEGWSRVIPSIVEAVQMGNALAPFDAPDAGNVEGREMTRLMSAVFKELVPERPLDLPPEEDQITEITLQMVVGVARRNKLFQGFKQLGTVESVLESEGEKSGFKFKKPDVAFEKETPEMEATAKQEQAEKWMNPSMRSWFGKFFKSKAASGRFWKADTGEVFEVGARDSNDLSKVILRRKGTGI